MLLKLIRNNGSDHTYNTNVRFKLQDFRNHKIAQLSSNHLSWWCCAASLCNWAQTKCANYQICHLEGVTTIRECYSLCLKCYSVCVKWKHEERDFVNMDPNKKELLACSSSAWIILHRKDKDEGVKSSSHALFGYCSLHFKPVEYLLKLEEHLRFCADKTHLNCSDLTSVVMSDDLAPTFLS